MGTGDDICVNLLHASGASVSAYYYSFHVYERKLQLLPVTAMTILFDEAVFL